MMKKILSMMCFAVMLSAGSFSLQSNDIKEQLSVEQVFDGFGCKGKNISPELSWSNAPKGTKSFAITVFDPDAPTGRGWWHWMVVNIPANVDHIAQGASNTRAMPEGAIELNNDFGKAGFGGACPPKGDKPHRYRFTIYALDVETLNVSVKSKKTTIEKMIDHHTIQKATIVSHYKR